MIARSYLYVPANNPAMLAKAPTRNADALIVDFEDAVPAHAKNEARQIFSQWINTFDGNLQVWVRINADAIEEDLKFISDTKITGVVVPKATEENLALVSKKAAKHFQISALIETAESVLNASKLADIERVNFLQIGQLDLRAELGLPVDGPSRVLEFAMNLLVLASAAAGINQPIAPIYRDFNDSEGLEISCRELKSNGYFGRSCIHPNQVVVINQVFSRSDEEINEAQSIISRVSDNGVGVDEQGRMIDAASVRIAQRILDGAKSN